MPPRKTCRPRTYALISLGCPKNLVDSERMAGLLERDGYELVRSPDGADLVVVNTCGFLSDARAESYGAIEEMLHLKERGRLGRVIVSGCLAERDREALLERYPEIDQLLGVFARDEIVPLGGVRGLAASAGARGRAALRGLFALGYLLSRSGPCSGRRRAVRWRIPAGHGSR